MDAIKDLERCLDAANDVLKDTAGAGQYNVRLRWLERQMASLVAHLQGLILDMESGLSLKDMGFSGNEDFEEMVQDVEVTIRSLKSQILTLKQVGR